MSHYPIFRNTWNFKAKDAWKYINLFPQHKITTKRRTLYSIHTNHIYSDRLVFQLHWGVKNFSEILGPFVPLSELVELTNSESLVLESFQFIGFSSEEIAELPSHDTRKSFLSAFHRRKRNLLQNEYDLLEFKQCSICSFTDDELNLLVENYKKFEAYLKKTNRL